MVMEAITEQNVFTALPAVEALPVERTEWPDDATREYHRLLRELNSWSRDHDWPMSGNSWIAEEAVRQSW
jgi:hypothetical protein